jgi:GTP-binding protein
MNTGPHVAIIGRPNVGKSALFNRIARRRIAIVHGEPGITRDRISTAAEADGKKFTLWDTGGIVGTGETDLTDQVRSSAERAVKESDLVLFVVDAQEGLNPIDSDLSRFLRRQRKPVVLVVNKVDHPTHEPYSAEFAQLGFDKAFSISAAHGTNVDDLLSEIGRSLPDTSETAEAGTAEAIKIAIIGRPNAGKSSFINGLVGNRRSIVSEMPGTTRDSVDIEYEREGRHYVFIDTAGIRARSKHSSSVEVFSVMRAEKTIARADICVLIVDAAEGAKRQDRRIAGLIQKARKPCVIVLNKWDLVRPSRNQRGAMEELIASARVDLFFINYAPVLVTSALTGEHGDRIFKMIERVRRSAQAHIGTGKLNRLLHAAIASNPPAMRGGKRLKLFYATQAPDHAERSILPPEFVLFVNAPGLVSDPFARFLESKIREAEPYVGSPVLLSFRARTEGP